MRRRRPAGRIRRSGPAAVGALALLVPVCVVYLWFPQSADGVLFEMGARRLADGEVFYRDFWDIKQPGIYWVYQLGLLLGLGVVGPRLVEIAAVLVGGLAVRWLTRGWGLHPVVDVLAPLLVVGSYLLMTHREGVLVVEGLTVPLLVVVLAAAWPVDPAGGPVRRPVAWVVAGVATGIVGLLKVVYLPLPATLLLGALVASHAPVRVRLGRLLAAVAGAAVPLLGAVAYFAWHGILSLAWFTTFRIPLETVSTASGHDAFANWAEMGVELGTLLVPLALVGLVGVRRRGTAVRELTLLLVAAEIAVLAFQQYPTPYRFLVVTAPVGLLAVVGADAVWRWAGAAGRRVPAAVLVVAAVLALPLARGPQRLVFAAKDVESWSLHETDRDARDAVLTDAYPGLDVDPVRGMVGPGDAVYVVGGLPQLYVELGVRREAVEITGWAASLMPERVWRERDRQLVRSRPRMVFVEHGTADVVRERAPGLTAMLAADYRQVATTAMGVWYRTETPGSASGVPGDNRLTTTLPSP